MPAFICSACGTQYPPSEAPLALCPVCEDERHFIPPEGQSWTTLEWLRISHHTSPWSATLRLLVVPMIGPHREV